MQFSIEINNQQVTAKRGETIKEVLDRNGIHVPTLCYMDGFSPTGGCRLCVVEVDGMQNLVPSCTQPVTEWMKIQTHSTRVLKARKTIVELLLVSHPDDCLYCDRNGKCGLQDLAVSMNIRERKYHSELPHIQIDRSCPSVERDPAKCLLCSRCIRVCNEIIGTGSIEVIGRGSESLIGTQYNKGLNTSTCVKCGQCILVCPTGALTERPGIQPVIDALNTPGLYPVIEFSPAVPVSIAEEFGIKTSKDILNILRAALKKIGFRQVYDLSMAADILLMEEATAFINHYAQAGSGPFFTSCCPAWVHYVENQKPDLLPNLSTIRSPQQIMGRLIKSYITSSAGQKPDNVFVVSVSPCTAKKHEAEVDSYSPGTGKYVDAVITVRELVKIIRMLGIDMSAIEPEPSDTAFGMRSSSGNMFGISGGHLEGLLRMIHFQMTGQDMNPLKISDLRGLKQKKEARIKVGKAILNVASVSGLAGVQNILEGTESGWSSYQIVEVMACPFGCINGGGQPLGNDDKSLKYKMKALYDVDEEEMIRTPYKNPIITDLYDKFLAQPGHDRNRELLHVRHGNSKII